MDTTQSPEKEYANQWDASAEFFYRKGYYSWMAQAVKEFHTVLEIGCGTGFSTLALLEAGHRVIAIDCNPECIAKAQSLIGSNETLAKNVVFLEGDVANPTFRAIIALEFSYDAVLCWNVGSCWSKEMFQRCLPQLHEYGLSDEQIREDPESSYVELVIWSTSMVASIRQVPIHLIERGNEALSEGTTSYYRVLKDEIGYRNVSYSNMEAESLSKSGRILSIKGVPAKEDVIRIVFTSVLIS